MENENLIEPSQRTDKWFKDRSGKFTGSRYGDLMAISTTDKPLKRRTDLATQVLGERLTGQYQETGMDAYALRHGREMEPFAIERYELETGLIVQAQGFITHREISFTGVSPDGLVGAEGGIEIKCPKNWDIHLARFETGMEDFHLPQVQGCMWVTDRKWWDFVSYDPRVNEHLRFYRQRIYRDDEYIDALKRQVMLAEGEVRTRIKHFDKENIEKILIERGK